MLCKCLRWMGEAGWGGCQPQPWRNDIVLTPHKWPRTPKSEPSWLGIKLCKADDVCQWAAYQCAQTLVCVWYGWGKQFEVAVSLHHDVMTSFRLHICHPDPQNLSRVLLVAITVYCCYSMPIDSIPIFLNALNMSNMDGGSRLRWLSASTTGLGLILGGPFFYARVTFETLVVFNFKVP